MTAAPAPSLKSIAYKALVVDCRLSGGARRVAGALVDRCNAKTGRCDPSVDRLAADTKLDRRNVQHALRELCEGEERLFDRESSGPGRGKTPSYRPRWDRFRAIVRDYEAGTGNGSEKGGDAATLSDSERAAQTVGKGGENGTERAALSPPEPLKETHIEPLSARERESDSSTRPLAHEGARPVGSALAEKVTTVNGVTVRYRPMAEDKAKGRRAASARIDQALLADGVELYMAVQERLTVEQVEQSVDVEVAYPGRGNGARMQRVLAEGGRFHPTPVNNVHDLLRAVPPDWVEAMAKIWSVPVEAVEAMLQAAIRHAATLPDDTTTLDIDAATLRAAPTPRTLQ